MLAELNSEQRNVHGGRAHWTASSNSIDVPPPRNGSVTPTIVSLLLDTSAMASTLRHTALPKGRKERGSRTWQSDELPGAMPEFRLDLCEVRMVGRFQRSVACLVPEHAEATDCFPTEDRSNLRRIGVERTTSTTRRPTPMCIVVSTLPRIGPTVEPPCSPDMWDLAPGGR